MKTVIYFLLIFCLYGCVASEKAFLLSRERIDNTGVINGTVFTKAIILAEKKEFIICSFMTDNMQNIDFKSMKKLASGTYKISTDTLMLFSEVGQIRNNKYLIVKDENGQTGLNNMPMDIVDKNGEKIGEIRGAIPFMNAIDPIKTKEIIKQLETIE